MINNFVKILELLGDRLEVCVSVHMKVTLNLTWVKTMEITILCARKVLSFSDAPSLKYYWQNEFHSLDQLDSKSDVIMTFGNSFIRHVVTMLSTARADCAFTNIKLEETHVLYVADSFYR